MIIIGGKRYSGNNVHIKAGGQVYIDGKLQTGEGEEVSGVVKMVVEGGLKSLRVDHGDVEVSGSVHGDVDAGGSVVCGNVGGMVDAGGSVRCLDVTGKVDAGGSVRCGAVGGKIKAGGSVRHG